MAIIVNGEDIVPMLIYLGSYELVGLIIVFIMWGKMGCKFEEWKLKFKRWRKRKRLK